jgi:rSAM/selenodomain-associated transferase 2
VTITVVIPTLNEERMLPATLHQAAELGFDDIVVVDGGSTDGTRQVVERLMADLAHWRVPAEPTHGSAVALRPAGLCPPRVALVVAPPGRGPQMNIGAATSQADVLLFLHADTTLPRQARSSIEQALTDPRCVAGRFDVRLDADTPLSRVIGRLMNWRSRLTGIATGDQALFVRRSVFERLGGFADIPIMEDVEFTRRLKRHGRVAAVRLPVVTSYRRWTRCGPVRTILLMWMLRGLYWAGISPHRLHHLYGTIR